MEGAMTAIHTTSATRSARKNIPPLEPGDRLDQPTFHERYERTRPGVKAELIEGVVYMPSPVGNVHSEEHALLNALLITYVLSTPGTKVGDNPTVILADDCEPQPDAVLRLVNGATKLVQIGDTQYLSGPPELVAEVASSTESIDLHAKRRDYERYGVGEYLVFLVRSRAVIWFVRDSEQFSELKPKAGVLKSRVFPGLWLDPAALLRGDVKRMLAVLRRGLATAEHADFVKRLTSEKRPGRRRK
jgi:Uma2 family endonuclease